MSYILSLVLLQFVLGVSDLAFDDRSQPLQFPAIL